MLITGFYAGLLAIVVMVLAAHIGVLRSRTGISILDGGNVELAERIRRHANFTESVPLPLILMAAIETGGASAALLHGLGSALLVCRIAHPIGLRSDNIRHPLRALGAVGTQLVTLVATGAAIRQFMGA